MAYEVINGITLSFRKRRGEFDPHHTPKMDLSEFDTIKDDLWGRWSWCDHCDCPIISCTKCPATSCNGLTCPYCTNDIDRALEMIKEGKAPSREETREPPRSWLF